QVDSRRHHRKGGEKRQDRDARRRQQRPDQRAKLKVRSSTMKRIIWAMVGIGVCLLAFRVGSFIPAYAQDAEWQKVDETLGRKPAVSDDVRRYGFPRSDLSVTLDGVTI